MSKRERTNHKASLIAIVVAILFFLVLPLQFKSSVIVCPHNSGTHLPACSSSAHTDWVWLGGYHYTVQRFLPKSEDAKIDYYNKYDTTSRLAVEAVGLLWFVLGGALTLVIIDFLSRAKSARKPGKTATTDT